MTTLLILFIVFNFTFLVCFHRVDETGWLHIQVNTSHKWDRKWAQLKDGVFRYADNQENPASSIFIPIENIIRLVTKDNVIAMKTKNEKLQMKTEEPLQVSQKLFSSFH